MKPKLLSLFVLTLMFSCAGQQDFRECTVNLIQYITEYPDSSYFKEIRSIYTDGQRIYLLDVARKDIAIFDENLENFHLIGRGGPGYKELTAPLQCYACKDSLYVLDGGANGIKTYNVKNGDFICAYPILGGSRFPFFYDNNRFVLPCITDSSTILLSPAVPSGVAYEDCLYGGAVIKFPTGKETHIRNGNILRLGEGCFYAISDNLPLIRKYDLETLTVLEEYDLSNISIIHKELNYQKNHPTNSNQYRVLFNDAYYSNGYMYLLLSRNIPFHTCNTIIKYDLSHKKTCYVYQLPHLYYDVFCVLDDNVYAFNNKDVIIEHLKLHDDE